MIYFIVARISARVLLPKRSRTSLLFPPAKFFHLGKKSFCSAEQNSKKKPLATDAKSLLRTVTNLSIYVVVYGLFGCIAYAVYKKYYVRKRRKESIDEFLPRNRFIKGNLPLVRYRGCVLSEDLIMSGQMEELVKFEFRPSDIVVASFPKSGTTWLQEVVLQLYKLKAPEEYFGLKIGDDVLENVFPYLEFPYPGVKNIEDRKDRRFIKTHLPCHLLPESVLTAKPKILYIYRNPKDVAVSYYHFARMLNFVKFRGSFERFVNLMIEDRVPYAPYFPHVHDYRKMTDSKPDTFFSVSYEDMKRNPGQEIRKIAKFLNLEDLTEEEVEIVVKATTFEAMKENPRCNYEHWDVWGIRDSKESEFMRKGKVGSHKEYFEDKYMAEMFERWIKNGTEGTNLKFLFDIDNK